MIWLENLAPFSSLRSSGYAYPIVLALHVSAISLFGALIVATDLRLLGWAFVDGPISDLITQLRWPKRLGFLAAATFGFLLFACKAEEYYYNPFFRAKILLFLLIAIHAGAFRRSIYSAPAMLDHSLKPPVRAKLAGSLSLFLWLAVLCAGRGIGYIMGRPGMHYK
ncbi:MAG TPA: DUF6644 family protein [Bryobacteraceae bacterium]|nr:DUF6644 family protein [Bryobacteraceae bacterium]